MTWISEVSFLISAFFCCLALASCSKLATKQDKHGNVTKSNLTSRKNSLPVQLRWRRDVTFLTRLWPPQTSSRSPWETPRIWCSPSPGSFPAVSDGVPHFQWSRLSSESRFSSISGITTERKAGSVMCKACVHIRQRGYSLSFIEFLLIALELWLKLQKRLVCSTLYFIIIYLQQCLLSFHDDQVIFAVVRHVSCGNRTDDRQVLDFEKPEVAASQACITSFHYFHCGLIQLMLHTVAAASQVSCSEC